MTRLIEAVESVSAARGDRSAPWFLIGALLCGIVAFVVTLTFHGVADGDLWAKLALGASVWEGAPGGLLDRDIFAFTPTLPKYVDHEWGAGWVFYGFLKYLGPTSLMLLKMGLALAALGIAAAIGRRSGTSLVALLLLAVPCALCVLPGYVPVIRSHAFSYVLFALSLGCLEAMDRGVRWAGIALVVIMAVWANLHGGWVAGFGIACVYAMAAVARRERTTWRFAVLLACAAVTLVNPYGFDYWRYLVPAVFHPRPHITEWRPMPLWGLDAFIGFRVLFALAVMVAIVGWCRDRAKTSFSRLAVLIITAVLAMRSRRHAPFFGLAALSFLGPYLDVALNRARAVWPGFFTNPARLALAVFVLHGGLAAWVVTRLLPQASLAVLAPVGAYPVREADILMNAGASGNLAVPFAWGSYAAWRLHPRVKVSMDGRYEAAYPESTFLLNQSFFDRSGADWDRLVREYPVDFVILDLNGGPLRPEDLRPYGFDLVWVTGTSSALLARGAPLESVRSAAEKLPPTTIEPLDAAIPKAWSWR